MAATSGSLSKWRTLAERIQKPSRAFIDGNYCPAASGETFDCASAIDGRLLARVSSCDRADADMAVAAARRAFNLGHWRHAAPRHRKQVMLRFADLLELHLEELAVLETLDVGKPIGDSLATDIPGAIRCIRWYAEAADKIYGEVAPTPADTLATITREPIGVVAAIVPWNFPLLMASWKFAPALAMGNSVVLKPSEKSPLTALRVAGLAVEAGLPNGVLNVLPGFGHTVGQALALHRDIDCIAFTGSTATGRVIARHAADSNLKRVWLECGGKSPNIVFGDAPDLDQAAKAAASGIFFNQGEMCSAASRLLVEDRIADGLLERLIRHAADFTPGDPLEEGTRNGALVDAIQADRVEGYVATAGKEGAILVAGGRRVQPVPGGRYLEPTIFDRVDSTMTIAREEVFGPVLSVIRFRDSAEAITIANSVDYGLAGAVWSADLATAHCVARAIRCGTVYVNCYDADDITVPFGGFRQSGNGRDKSLHALDKYTELKTTWIRIGTPIG